MGIIIWVVAGIIFGIVVNFICSRDNLILNGILGVAGAALAGWIATLAGVGAWNAFNFWNLVIAAVGAILVSLLGGKLLSKV